MEEQTDPEDHLPTRLSSASVLGTNTAGARYFRHASDEKDVKRCQTKVLATKVSAPQEKLAVY